MPYEALYGNKWKTPLCYY